MPVNQHGRTRTPAKPRVQTGTNAMDITLGKGQAWVKIEDIGTIYISFDSKALYKRKSLGAIDTIQDSRASLAARYDAARDIATGLIKEWDYRGKGKQEDEDAPVLPLTEEILVEDFDVFQLVSLVMGMLAEADNPGEVSGSPS